MAVARKPRKTKRVRPLKRTATPVLSKRAKAYVKPAPKTAPGKRKRVSNVTSAKRAKKGTAALKRVVVANAKAIKSIKDSTWGKYQTHNSVIGGGASVENMHGGAAFTLNSMTPCMLHLNNLHSDPLLGAPKILRRKTVDANGAVIAPSETGICNDFENLGQFSSNGVLQKPVLDKTTGLNGVPQATPYPNGEKIKWHGTDLTFEVSGYMRNTTIDFWIVQEKPQAKEYDPWNAKTDFALQAARHLPYTISEFNRVSERMTPHKIPTNRYNVLGHKRCFVNNMQEAAWHSTNAATIKEVVGERHLGAGTGGTLVEGTPFGATTKPKQYVHIKFAPHTGLYPLKKAIGEAEGASTHGSIRPNPYETRSLGTMHWDNFDPKANKWLIITTDFKEVIPRSQLTGFNEDGTQLETSAQYSDYLTSLAQMSPNIKCLRRCWWQDPYTPSAVMGVYPDGGRHLQHIQTITRSQWDGKKARLTELEAIMAANPGNTYSLPELRDPVTGAITQSAVAGGWWESAEVLREFFHRFPDRTSPGVLPDP